jgi:hypothetical protein
MTAVSIDFHVSQATKFQLALCSKGACQVRTMLTEQLMIKYKTYSFIMY